MKKIILIALIFGIILFSGCLDEGKTDNTEIKAPGCEGAGIVPTGCLGKSVIKDINAQPTFECLKLDANNCNGGILGIENRCDTDLEIGGKTVHANSYKGIEFVRNREGKIFVTEPGGNVDTYNPEDEDLLSVKGKLGEKEITISYTKKNVCGTAKIPDIRGIPETDKASETEGVSLKMDKTIFARGEKITASVETEKKILIGFPGFDVYQLSGDEWLQIDIYCLGCYSYCTAETKYICEPVACAPLPEHCMDFNPSSEKFEWDQTVCRTRKVECPGGEDTACFYEEKVEPGTYKVVFKYSENCVDEWLFDSEENNVQTIEKQFKIKDS